MRKKHILLITGLLLTTITSCGSYSSDDTKKLIIDSVGDEVFVPKEINKVITTTEPSVDMMVALGIGDKIIACYKSIFNNPWLNRFWSDYSNVESLSTYEPETEYIVSTGADIVFVPTKERAESLRNKGICAITLRMFSPNETRQGVQILGELFGDSVKTKGSQWIQEFDNSITDIASNLTDVELKDRKSCYQLMGDKYKGLFRTNYGDTLDYFVYGGGRSATADLTGMFTDAMPTEESVLATNPDVIFINGKFASKLNEDVRKDQRWSTINAVVNNEIYLTPMGMCDWSYEASELILMNYWVFKCLYPERCTYDLKAMANTFYSKYFNVTFTSDELDKLFTLKTPEGKELCD